MSRIIAFDVGTHTIGVAQSDLLQTLAQPVKTFRGLEQEWGKMCTEIFSVIPYNTVSTVVIGMPKNMDNSMGESAARSQRFKKSLEKHLRKQNITTIEIVFFDERLTTKQADQILIGQNLRREKRKKVIDTVAAVLILEDYLRFIQLNK